VTDQVEFLQSCGFPNGFQVAGQLLDGEVAGGRIRVPESPEIAGQNLKTSGKEGLLLGSPEGAAKAQAVDEHHSRACSRAFGCQANSVSAGCSQSGQAIVP
jgi:hypothetical protein